MRQEQAIGALIICLITVVITCAIIFVPRCFIDEQAEQSEFAIDSVLADSLRRQWQAAHPTYTYKKKQKKNYPKYVRTDTVQIRMQYFDPNTADSLTLLRVGMRPWQAKGILHYRQKGGHYRKAEDLKKLYGMTDSMYAALEPWVLITELAVDSVLHADSVQGADSLKQEFVRTWHEKKDTILELNLADTASLQYIRGIGPTIARQIVQKRTEYGGFVDVTQLAGVEGVPKGLQNVSWTLDSLYAHFTVDTSLIRLLNVNHASVRQLVKHPYISYDQAKMIENLRHRRTIKSEEDLYKYGIFSRVELDKLRPYLSYEK